MDQMNPTISRAMATVTTLAVLPRALSRRYRVQSSNLRFPPDVANDFWQRLNAIDLVTADARLHPVSDGAFDQRAPGVGVAGLGDAAPSDGLATRSLARDQAEIGHKLARIGEAREVADFRDQHHGIDQRDPAHCLQGVDNWAQIPFGEQANYLFLDSLQAPFCVHDGVDIILKGDLLSRMLEGKGRQPSPVSHAPCRPTAVLAAVTQKKSLKVLTRARHDVPDDAAQPDQIAHRFVVGVRNPNRRQLSGSMKTGKHGGVATICLYAWRARGAEIRRALEQASRTCSNMLILSNCLSHDSSALGLCDGAALAAAIADIRAL